MLSYLKQLWFEETRGLTKAALLVSIASFLSRLAGVWRDRVLASTFGADAQLDAYYAAFRLPDMIYMLLILGALTAGFVPLFTEYRDQRSEREAWQLSEQILSLIGCALALVGVGLFFAAPAIVPWTVHGFPPETIALTVTLTRIMCLSPFLLGISAVMGGALQATRRLFAFALAPILYNLGIIFGAYVLSPRLGIPGLAWGVVIGAALHMLVQTSVVLRLGLRRLPVPSFRPEGVRRLLALMGPRTAGLAVAQINLVILLSFASSLSAGSVAVFNLANNLQSFPIGIIGVSFAIAAFPILSSAVAQQNQEAFQRVFSQTINRIVFFLLPTMALFLLFRYEIVQIILGEGRFDQRAATRAALVLGWFSISLLAQALIPLFARGFYALQNTWTPFWVSLIAEGVNIAAAFVLRDVLGVAGLAAAFSLAACVQLVLLWMFLHRRQRFHGLAVVRHAVSVSLATAMLMLVIFLLKPFVHDLWPADTLPILIWRVACLVLAGGLGFIFIASLLRIPEWRELRTRLSILSRRE